jgi:4-hydroxy-tetrahydrodipicolinate reductase
MHQTASGTVNGRTVIEAVVRMSAGADNPRDEIEIDATPPIRMTIAPAIMGDTATAAIIVNAVPRVVAHAEHRDRKDVQICHP